MKTMRRNSMTLKELKTLNKKEIVEVNGIQLGFHVSMLSNINLKESQEEALLKSYYDFLEQSKKTGFMTQYIKMPAARALSIFENINVIDEKDSQCFRKVQEST